jgi:hypothetical protein
MNKKKEKVIAVEYLTYNTKYSISSKPCKENPIIKEQVDRIKSGAPVIEIIN